MKTKIQIALLVMYVFCVLLGGFALCPVNVTYDTVTIAYGMVTIDQYDGMITHPFGYFCPSHANCAKY